MQPEIVYLADFSDLVTTCASWAFNTWGKYNSAYTLDKRIESFTKHCNKDEIPLTLLAMNDERKPVGMASIRPTDGIRPELSPWLGSVYVDPLYRNQGIAAQLVQETHRKALQLGFNEMYLLTYEVTLPQWYARLGWKDAGTDSCHGNHVTVMSIVLNKNS